MDPGTLLPLAQLHPDLRFVVPRAGRAEALKRTGATNDRLIPVDAGQLIEPWPGLSIVALRAAHETSRLISTAISPFWDTRSHSEKRAATFRSSIPETRFRSQGRV